MHQAGHFDDAFKRTGQLIQAVLLQQLLLFQSTEDLFGDITPYLLNFHRVRQARTHCRVTLQRKDLGFLLQSANSRRIDNASTVAFENAQDLMLRFHALRRTVTTMPVYFFSEIDLCHVLSRLRNALPLKRMIDYALKSGLSRVNL